MPLKLDPRQTHIGVPVRLDGKRIEKMRKMSGYKGKLDRRFFEEVVWWWRPLARILAVHTPFEALEKQATGFFPKSLFKQLQFAYLVGDVRRLSFMWTGEEIAARVQGHHAHYPAFIDNSFLAIEIRAHPDWSTWRRQKLEVDLGTRKAEILRTVSRQIDSMRNDLFSKTRQLIDEAPKGAVFEADVFRACEFIDVEMFGLSWPANSLAKFDASVIRRAMRAHLAQRK
jgi:hypothetical protein